MWPTFSNYMGVGVVIMGCQKSKILFTGLREIYLSCYNLFLQFLNSRRGNKRLKTVLPMLSWSALERSNNPYIASIVGPCLSKNHREIFAVSVWFWMKSWKRLRQWKKVSMSRRRNLCTCVLEWKKITALKLL